MDDFLASFFLNLLYGIMDGGLSMFESIGNFLVWILGAILYAF